MLPPPLHSVTTREPAASVDITLKLCRPVTDLSDSFSLDMRLCFGKKTIVYKPSTRIRSLSIVIVSVSVPVSVIGVIGSVIIASISAVISVTPVSVISVIISVIESSIRHHGSVFRISETFSLSL